MCVNSFRVIRGDRMSESSMRAAHITKPEFFITVDYGNWSGDGIAMCCFTWLIFVLCSADIINLHTLVRNFPVCLRPRSGVGLESRVHPQWLLILSALSYQQHRLLFYNGYDGCVCVFSVFYSIGFLKILWMLWKRMMVTSCSKLSPKNLRNFEHRHRIIPA